MASDRFTRPRWTRFASLALSVTFLAAHPAIVCTLACLAQGHEVAGLPATGGTHHHHHDPGHPDGSCHDRALTVPHVVIAMALAPALPTRAQGGVPLSRTVAVPGHEVGLPAASNTPMVDRPPPRLA